MEGSDAKHKYGGWLMPRSHARRTEVEEFIGRHPLLLSAIALGFSATIEILQAWPERIPMGHEVGEVARNLGYGIAAAFVFNWIMVEIPAKREERRILDSYWGNLNYMSLAGGMLLAHYRKLAPDGEYNTQTEAGMKQFLETIPLISSRTPPVPGFAPSIGGEPMVPSDPFEGTGLMEQLEGHGKVVSPFLHRLEPKVADSVTELMHFRQRINYSGPVYRQPGTLEQEFWPIWQFVTHSRKVRQALKAHYPQRELPIITLLSPSPDMPIRQIEPADL